MSYAPTLTPPPYSARAIILDTETHDRINPRLVEAAYAYAREDGTLDEQTLMEQRFNPGMPISLGAMATHHIIDADVAHCPAPETFALPSDVGYIIGHNIEFDLEAIGRPQGLRAIDTLALARKAWPDMDNHKQGTLFYYLAHERQLDIHAAREFATKAHGAGVDIQMCALILESLIAWARPLQARLATHLQRTDLSVWDTLHTLSETAKVPLIMTFGKHQGMATEQLPESYKAWYRGVDEPDPYVLLAMDAGGQAESGRALYQMAQVLYGSHDAAPQVAEVPVAVKPAASTGAQAIPTKSGRLSQGFTGFGRPRQS